jgi:hypothetical protein
MPLRDHFRPPIDDRHSWDELHGGWPMVIVQKLGPKLPPEYVAAPRVHLGSAKTELPTPPEYEVLVYDVRRGRRLWPPSRWSAPATRTGQSIAAPSSRSVRRSCTRAYAWRSWMS